VRERGAEVAEVAVGGVVEQDDAALLGARPPSTDALSTPGVNGTGMPPCG
jgi:hypothetical protein